MDSIRALREHNVVLVIPKDSIPPGASVVEAFKTKRGEYVICGDPDSDPDHNCDWRGCGSFSHVVYRSSQDNAALLARAEKAEIERDAAIREVSSLGRQLGYEQATVDALRKAAEGIASDIPDLYGDHVEGGWLSVNLSADAVDELLAALAAVEEALKEVGDEDQD